MNYYHIRKRGSILRNERQMELTQEQDNGKETEANRGLSQKETMEVAVRFSAATRCIC